MDGTDGFDDMKSKDAMGGGIFLKIVSATGFAVFP
jgi:hypothetical protein